MPSSDEQQSTKTPSSDEDGKNNKTSDASSAVGLFAMFTGLVGTIRFRKRK